MLLAEWQKPGRDQQLFWTSTPQSSCDKKVTVSGKSALNRKNHMDNEGFHAPNRQRQMNQTHYSDPGLRRSDGIVVIEPDRAEQQRLPVARGGADDGHYRHSHEAAACSTECLHTEFLSAFIREEIQ
jgi:hypothetical protein